LDFTAAFVDTLIGNSAILALRAHHCFAASAGYDLSNYAKIFKYARVHRLPLVGLNVPRAVVNLVRTRGIAELPPALKNALPEMDLTNAAHYARFRKNMAGLESFHGPMSPESLARFYEAQTLVSVYSYYAY
jgi:uncharacterized iron-regulated protein